MISLFTIYMSFLVCCELLHRLLLKKKAVILHMGWPGFKSCIQLKKNCKEHDDCLNGPTMLHDNMRYDTVPYYVHPKLQDVQMN